MYHCIYIMLAMCMNGVHRCGAAACVSAAFVFASLPAMALYRAYGHISLGWNVLLMAVAGCCVNGPYALITTAVSADLGNHSSVAGADNRPSRDQGKYDEAM